MPGALRTSALTLLAAVATSLGAQTKPAPAYYFNPKWSPDGRSIVFESTREGKFAVYTIRVDGSALTRLTTPTVNSEQPNWSPDGRRIVYSSDSAGHLDLYIMNADGSAQTRVTTTSGGGFYGSKFSPDGKWITFQGRHDNALVSEKIFVVRPDGTGWRQLTDSSTSSMSPRWSPDGRSILFVQQPVTVQLWKDLTRDVKEGNDRAQEVMTIRPDGPGLTRLTRNQVTDDGARWSRDSRRVTFTSEQDGIKGLYEVNADGSGLRRIGDPPTEPGGDVSPDGRSISYTKAVSGTYGLYVYEIATKTERLLISGPAPAR